LAWRSQKTALRKRLNGRWLRWKLWRGVFRVLPLAGRYAFPMAGAGAIEAASQVIADTAVMETGDFTPKQMKEIVIPALANDKMRVRHAPGSCRIARQVAIIPDCAVLGHVGAVARMSDMALLFPRGGALPNWNYARPKKLKTRRFGDGLVTSLQDTHHYYHFFEQLIPLLGYLDAEHEPGSPLTVLLREGGAAFQRSVCAAVEAAYPGVRFIGLDKDERAEIRRYLWLHEMSDNVEWLPVTAQRAARLGAIMRGFYGQPAPRGGERIFFSRGEAKARRLINETELEAIAARHGFTRFEATSGNHPEQVSRFANADAVIAVHGAGLTNLIFARPGTAVMELFPSNCIKSTYLWLSNRLDLRHYPLLGSDGDYHQAFQVDPRHFEARLGEICAASGHDAPSASVQTAASAGVW
jgi:hypothetical protein